MAHPYLFFVKLFEILGLEHFAHAYPHVIYSWVVMILLITLGAIAAKGIQWSGAKECKNAIESVDVSNKK